MFLLSFRKLRDKPDSGGSLGLSTQEISSSRGQQRLPEEASNATTLTSTLNAYYTKHFVDKRQQQFDQVQASQPPSSTPNSQQDPFYQSLQQTLANKIKSKIYFISKESDSAAATPTTENTANKAAAKATTTSSSSSQAPLTSTATLSTPYSLFKRSAKLKKLDSLTIDKRSRFDSEADLFTGIVSTAPVNSHSSSGSSVDLSGGPHIDYSVNKSKIKNMINTPVTLASKSSSNLDKNNNTPPIVQQPQFVLNMSNGGSNGSGGFIPDSPMSPMQTSSRAAATAELTETSNNFSSSSTSTSSKVNNNSSSSSPYSPPSNSPQPTGPVSLSYLDEANLRMAIVEYPDIVKLVKLHNIDYYEWLAFNTKMYFDQINVLFGAVAEFCTPQTCPTMNAPCNQQFYWMDEKGKKCKYSASQYIDTVLTHSAKVIGDENLFPTNIGSPFPANFETLVKRIHRHLFQILAHIYHNHYKELLQLKLNTYANSIYFHLYTFSRMFNLVEEKELEIMDTLNKQLVQKYANSGGGGGGGSAAAAYVHNQQPTMIYQPLRVSTSAPAAANNSSGSSSGFSFFKKKLNFNLIP